MNSIRRVLPWLALAIIAALIWYFLPNRKPSRNEAAVSETRAARAGRGNTNSASAVTPDPQLTRLMERSLEAFLKSKGADDSASILAELREQIRSAANEQAAATAIRAFLLTGKDAPTKLPLVIGPDGTLESAPTLRSALLDLLGSLDPETALTASREIMDRKSSPDEYALALRNLAWNDMDGDLKPELSRRFNEMLATKDWLAQPSAGFLEALDAAVEISDASAFNALMLANHDAESAFSRAAFIAMDRMVLRDPSLLVAAFHADPSLTGLSTDQRASLMSRLDITDPPQREIFSRYLTASDHGPQELEYFTALFPNGNQLHGNWLITGSESPRSIDEQKIADQQTLEQLHRMGDAHEVITRIRDRLNKVLTEPTK
jgi:hypothetical protein